MKARQIITITLFALLSFSLNATAQAPELRNQTKETFVNLKTFPSPSDGNFLIEMDLNTESQVEILLLDMNGRLVHEILPKQPLEGGALQLPVNLDSINEGMYLLLVDADGYRKTERLVFKNY